MSETRQVFDLPVVKYEVTEHHAMQAICSCGQVHTRQFPAGVNAAVQYGPRALATGISRHTIRADKKKFDSQNLDAPADQASAPVQTAPPWSPTPPAAPAAQLASASICEPYRDYIEAQLRLKRNAMAIYQDLVDQFGFTGAYNAVKRFTAKLRYREPEQFDRLDFAPAEEMQVDYGEGAPTRVLGTTRYRKPRLFVATLRYSRRSYRRVVWKSSQQTWARLHEQAWRYFGGSCRYVVLDNLKEGVLQPDIHEPELNPVYAAALKHYSVVGDPARVRDPNRKGTVENAIGHTQATALKGRRFETIEEQNDFLEHWEVTWAATRIHGSERRQVQAMFDEEKPHLQALPIVGMQYFTESQRTVYDDTCVRVDHSSYAARPAPIGSLVLVRIFEHRIEIRDLQSKALLRKAPVKVSQAQPFIESGLFESALSYCRHCAGLVDLACRVATLPGPSWCNILLAILPFS